MIRIIILTAGLIISSIVVNHNNIVSKAYGQTYGPDILDQNERNHAQLSFCFGGYVYVYGLSKNSDVAEDKKLAARMYKILEALQNKMVVIEYAIAKKGNFDGVWSDMFEVAMKEQFMAGARYVKEEGLTNLLPDIEKCEIIIREKVM